MKFVASSANYIKMSAVMEGHALYSNVRNILATNGWEVRKIVERTTLLKICSLFVAIIITSFCLEKLRLEVKKSSQPRFKRSITTDDNSINGCTSTACVRQLNAIVSAMDTSVDPCQDFYQYACGRFNHSDSINSKINYRISFERIEAKHHLSLKKFLEETADSFESEAEKNAKRYYQSCLQSRKTTYAEGLDKTLFSLLNLIGGVQINDAISYVRNFKTTNWDFQETIETAQHILNVDIFFHWTVKLVHIPKNNLYYYGQHIIELSHSELTLPLSSYLLEDKVSLTSKFNQQMHEMANSLNLQNNNSTLTSEISQTLHSLNLNDIIEVETKIAQIIPSVDESTKLTIADLNTLAPFMNWEKFFQSAFSQVSMAISPSHLVLVPSTAFLRDVFILVNKLLSSGIGHAKLKNYLYWRTAHQLFQIMKKRFQKEEDITIKNDCVADTAKAMPFALGAMFIRKEVESNSRKQLAETMVESIKEAFKENLGTLAWMDVSTHLRLREKVDAVTALIGYPEFILNPAQLDEFYGGLEFKADEYFMNNMRLKRYSSHKELIKLDEPANKNEWTDAPFAVSPNYLASINRIVLPSGILYQPFFDVTFPHAINFGSLGTIFGHELQHGFTDKGLHFDWNGIWRPWLDIGSIQRFKKQANCLILQYSNYTNKNGRTVDGNLSLDENISDNGGLKAAFRAFIDWTTPHEDAIFLLPGGMNVTNKQLFFLSFAQVLCSPYEESNNLKYPPNRYRVLGSLSNMHAFSSAFQCPLGSLMNPTKKCEI